MSTKNEWLPRSVLCLRGYTSEQFIHDLIAGITVGLGCLATGDGLWHCIGSDPAGWVVYGGRRWLPDFCLGRFANPDRRTHRRICRDCCGNCGPIRHVRPCPGHAHGRSFARHYGSHRPGRGGQIHSPSGHHRLHQRYCAADCLHPNQRLSRPHHSARSERISQANGSAHRALGNDAMANGSSRLRFAGHHFALAANGTSAFPAR